MVDEKNCCDIYTVVRMEMLTCQFIWGSVINGATLRPPSHSPPPPTLRRMVPFTNDSLGYSECPDPVSDQNVKYLGTTRVGWDFSRAQARALARAESFPCPSMSPRVRKQNLGSQSPSSSWNLKNLAEHYQTLGTTVLLESSSVTFLDSFSLPIGISTATTN